MNGDWLLPGATKDTQSITADWAPVGPALIHGVRVHEVRHVAKMNGRLTEVYRRDWRLGDAEIDQVFEVVLDAGCLSAWHAHGATTDRLFITQGRARVVLYDARPESPSCGVVNEFRLGDERPAVVVIPPRVWHGVQNIGPSPARILNMVDRAYEYADPDHWRIPADSPHVPFRFAAGAPGSTI
ncbi:MAG: dTDP-4-dehydrorhamnose 3,5-epimerase family protein [Acidobacteria bacterium]|nr:dTDP-4-dehydrorhamnose 3,5-epimerase family protein [Acidobacteriota bacterium]